MSLAAMPAVSVVIPTYNRADYVCQAIDSVLAQTFRSVEIIVVDDGSIDDTEAQIAARYGGRVRYHWQENQGESAARNRGIALARGDYIALLDSDDLWHEDKLCKQMAFLKQARRFGMVSTAAQYIDADGAWIPTAVHANASGVTAVTGADLIAGNVIRGPSSVLIRREVLEQTGGFDARIQYGEDWDLWLRVAAITQIAVLEQPLTYLRLHRHSQSYAAAATTNDRRLREHLTIIGRAYQRNRVMVAPAAYRTAVQRQYQHAFLRAAAVHNRPAAACYWLHVNTAEDNGDTWLTRIAQFAPTAVEMADDMPGTAVGNYLKIAFVVVGRDMTAADRRRTAAHAYAAVGYAAYAKKQVRTARSCFLQTLWLDVTWLGNVGFVALLVELLVGTAVAERLRSLARRMQLPALLARVGKRD